MMEKYSTLTEEQKLALGINDDIQEQTKAISKRGRKPKSTSEIAKQQMLESFGEESTEVAIEKTNKEVSLSELLDSIEINADTIQIVEKNKIEIMQDAAILNAEVDPTYEVVCNQSAYVAQMKGLKFSDLNALENSNGTEFTAKNKLIKLVYNKISSTSIGNIPYETFLKNTSLYDLQTLIFGIYNQTFKSEADFTVTCNHEDCKQQSSIKVPNNQLICIKDEETFGQMRNIISKITQPEKALEHSVLIEKTRIILPVSKIAIDIKIPELYKYLDIMGSVKPENFEEHKNLLAMMIFIDGLYKIDLGALVKDKKVQYYEVKDKGEIAREIDNLSIDDTAKFQKIVKEKTEKYAITYAIKNMPCPKCGKPLGQMPIDMEFITFFRLEQM